MDLIKQIIFILLSSFGIIAGFIVSKNAEEELTDGKKHFRIICLISSFFILAYALFIAFKNPIITSFIPTLFIVILLYVFKKYEYYLNAGVIGVATGYLLLKTDNYVVPSIVFFFFMIHGTLVYIESQKFKQNVNIQGLINSMIFVVLSIITLILITTFK